MLTSSVKAILKAMIDTVFLGPRLGGGQNFLLTPGGFYNEREYSGADWLVPFVTRNTAKAPRPPRRKDSHKRQNQKRQEERQCGQAALLPQQRMGVPMEEPHRQQD